MINKIKAYLKARRINHGVIKMAQDPAFYELDRKDQDLLFSLIDKKVLTVNQRMDILMITSDMVKHECRQVVAKCEDPSAESVPTFPSYPRIPRYMQDPWAQDRYKNDNS